VTPYYEDEACVIYHGDCREVLPHIDYGAVVSDPPWGTNTACNAQRFTRAASPFWANVDNSKVRAHERIANDDRPFVLTDWIDDPATWLSLPCIFWGATNFCHQLPESNGWLVWDKRRGAEDVAEKGWSLGEAELAWTNTIGATRVFRNLWVGLLRSSEKGEFYHPTQKPVALMEWCLSFVKGHPVIIDPFAGSGSTLVAAKRVGRKAIGIEREQKYCDIAVRRLQQAALPLAFEPQPKQVGIFDGDVA
jgi:DNA modification methylase